MGKRRMAKVWRLNIKPSASEDIDPRMFCIKKNILGVGWSVEFDGNVDWETYYKLAMESYYNQGLKGWWPAVNAIKNRMKIDDLCWTRDWNGIYYLGQIVGDWNYRGEKDYRQADVVNIRKCDWKRVGTIDSVPGKVMNSFIPPRTVQAINDESVLIYSQFLFNELSGQAIYPLPNKSVDLFSLISAEDCEDLVGLFLQEKGYRIIPSSCRADTAAYEFVLKHSETGNAAVAQVKQGYVDLSVDDYKMLPTEVFLFTTHGNYKGGYSENVHCISPEEIETFASNRQGVLSDRVKTWISIIENLGKNIS